MTEPRPRAEWEPVSDTVDGGSSSIRVRLLGMVVVWALTGPLSFLSTTGLTEVAAAVLPRAGLLEVVGNGHPDPGGQRGVVVAEVLPRCLELVAHARDSRPRRGASRAAAGRDGA